MNKNFFFLSFFIILFLNQIIAFDEKYFFQFLCDHDQCSTVKINSVEKKTNFCFYKGKTLSTFKGKSRNEIYLIVPKNESSCSITFDYDKDYTIIHSSQADMITVNENFYYVANLPRQISELKMYTEDDLSTSAFETEHKKSKMDSLRLRNFIGFWLLGLCNNYAYCVMLGAAHDILSEFTQKVEANDEICNPQSTGIILLLDIIPSLLIKSFSPFISGYTSTKIVLNVICSFTSYLLTGLAYNQLMAYVGVAFASLASGLGEVAILGYLSKFNPNAISAWSSGTGGAGLFASASYFFLTKVHFSPKKSILIMLVIPFIMFFSFFFIIVEEDDTTNTLVDKNTFEIQDEKSKKTSLKTKLGLLRSLMKYMVPLFFVYYFEYFINQGLSELLNFKDSIFNHDEQYRLYQVEYQLGVLISRSSVNFVQIDKIWVLPILQGINLLLILGHILHPFLTTFWITSCIIIFEGLIGGAAYVNTFSKLKKTDEIAPSNKEFAMSMTCFSDTFGISLSGFTAIPAHNLLCSYMKRHY